MSYACHVALGELQSDFRMPRHPPMARSSCIACRACAESASGRRDRRRVSTGTHVRYPSPIAYVFVARVRAACIGAAGGAGGTRGDAPVSKNRPRVVGSARIGCAVKVSADGLHQRGLWGRAVAAGKAVERGERTD